ncbi:MAG: class II fructose-bisphosphatase [Firmicutes bacterium]|nr:class II fructose-bisphosphatase [Alicyclobacillaceae bacterium]MCL6497680.1 class II fructose-bisphosphatase [Bacillota bacterium]
MERELALEFVRVTEAAAMAAGRLLGRGDKSAADQAAVDAMRAMLDTVDIRGTVVIGEGEMDEAPMLYIGETVGSGHGEPVDIAVDPLEGTNLVAKGLPGALAVMAVAPPGCLLHAPDMYMEKIVSGPAGRGRLDLTRPIGENLEALAEALGKPVAELTVVVLERERHAQLIADIRRAGARVRLISDGDVAPAVATGQPASGIDLVVGTGGAPEGVIAAAGVKCLGGEMQARLAPQDDEDRRRMAAMGIHDPDRVLGLEDLVRGDDVLYVATAITDCYGLPGVRYGSHGVVTHTVVMRSLTGTIRYIVAEHREARGRRARREG